MTKFNIVSSRIFIEWNDTPKEELVFHEMPNDLQELFDEWLATIEDERNALKEQF